MNNYLLKQPKARPLPSGSWRSEVQYNNTRKSFVADSEEEAVRLAFVWKLTMTDSPEAKELLKDERTLGEAIDQYVKNRRNIDSPDTLGHYLAIRNYGFKSIMNSRISELTQVNWQQLVNDEADQPCVRAYKGKITVLDQKISRKTLSNRISLVKSVLREYGILVPKVRLPQAQKHETAFLEPEQIRVFLKAIEGHVFEVAYLLGLHGLRRSELMNVRKSDIVTKDGRKYIHVHGAMVHDENGKLIEKVTNKTAESNRLVPVLIPRLLDLVDQMPDGKLVEPQHINSLYVPLQKILKENVLPQMGLHGLRHTFASLCYYLNISETVTQKWGGWSDFRVVRTIYLHLSKKEEIAAIDKMTSFFK